MSEKNLNEVLNSNTKLEPSEWESIKEKLRELNNEALKEYASLQNPVIVLLSKQILLERKAIKI